MKNTLKFWQKQKDRSSSNVFVASSADFNKIYVGKLKNGISKSRLKYTFKFSNIFNLIINIFTLKCLRCVTETPTFKLTNITFNDSKEDI